MPKSHNTIPKSNLKLVKPPSGGGKPPRDGQIRPWVKAPAGMPADRYKVVVEAAARVTKFSRPMAELEYTVLEGDYAGVCLPGWIRMDFRAGRRLKPGCVYERYCQMALETDDLPDDLSPSLFVGKIFIAEATYARTDGKSRAEQDETVSKGPRDYLRVVKLVSLSGL
jgi:hypothetical protein